MAITVQPITPTFGAEVGDVVLGRPLAAADLADIRAAFGRHVDPARMVTIVVGPDAAAMAAAAAEHRDGRNSPEVAKGYSPGDVLILTNLQALAALSKGDQARAVRPRTVMPEAE